MSLILPRRAVLSGLVAAPAVLSTRLRAELSYTDYPFSLGVAAGEMTPDGFVLWTRLAPSPMEAHGGMPMKPVTVDWEVATDAGMKQTAAKGTATAYPGLAHSVHVEVSGLRPATRYYYRFRCAGERSAAGTVATLPTPGAAVARVRFASVGCQHFEQGWYTAYRDVAEQPLDFVFHYGDYIYEEHDRHPGDTPGRVGATVRRYSGRSPFSLDDYRIRYAETKLDGDLQAAHASTGWYSTYDDHEVQNNWVADLDQDHDPAEIFLFRRRAALQAWYEHMPVRPSAWSETTGTAEFRRRVDYGTLARFHFPNTRLYRTDQPCGDGFKAPCAEMRAAGADMLGKPQWGWLEEGFQSSRQRWNLLPQQVMVAAPDRRQLGTSPMLNMDSWAGYPAAREKLLSLFADHKGGNVVVLTGDEHRNWANDLVWRDRIVGSEFVSTSITSGGDVGVLSDDNQPGPILANNDFVKWINDQRGYVLTDISPDACLGRFRTVESIVRPSAPVNEAAVWGVSAGKAGLAKG
jgi:alkaline phosphatase D